MLETAGLKGFTSQAYFNIQTSFLIPAVNREWEQERMAALEESEDGLIVAGDARYIFLTHLFSFFQYLYIMEPTLQDILHIISLLLISY